HYGISPATGYKWLQRWAVEGASGLQDRPRTPRHSPNRSSDDITDLLRMAHERHARWGARKIKRWLEDRGHRMPAFSTVHNLMARHGLLPGASPGIPATGRFEHDAPNRLWQMDFKGHFPFGGGRCHPLTLLDDHSRFSLYLAHCNDERLETVQQQLVSVFERYGLPDRMTMDNGSPWGDTTGTWTALELWLMRQGIRVGHSRPYHPQTQGKLERFHRSLKAEVLQGKWFADRGELQRAFDHWRTVYNLERPHEALDMAVPASRYQPSARQYSSNTTPPEYDEGVMVRKVDISGKLSVKGVSLSAGKAFRGERVGLKEMQEDGCYEVWWYSTKVGVIDLKKQSITMGKEC
ncbi:IS481 family transposase, partial [Enterobacter quasiroggenkampii]|uniref:IS481 family transposase n=1 Tax=Enterobacter quasiroggenkampii TaxID=2497436 RepID=UPI0021D1355B